jgi:hypothetical protein
MKVRIRFHGGPQDGNVRTFDEHFVGMVIHAAHTYCCAEDCETVAYKLQGANHYPFTYTVEEESAA